MTLIEMLITLAVIGLMLMVGAQALVDVRNSNLREDTVQVIAALRSAANQARMTGVHHRVVFEMDGGKKQSFRIETCTGEVRLRRGDEEERADAKEVENLRQELARRSAPQEDSPETPEKALAVAAAVKGVKLGETTCALAEMPPGASAKGTIRTDRGLHIRRIFVQHLEEPVSDGQVSINFFPLGNAEKAIVQLMNEDGDQYSVLVHGLSGRIELESGSLEAPEEHLLRDATGQREKER
jgi:prepilin-type N-terminal cleavage/methylation domain-containing protein